MMSDNMGPSSDPYWQAQAATMIGEVAKERDAALADNTRLRAALAIAEAERDQQREMLEHFGRLAHEDHETLRNQRDDARAALKLCDEALIPFSIASNTDIVQNALKARQILTVTTGLGMIALDPQDFENARAARAAVRESS